MEGKQVKDRIVWLWASFNLLLLIIALCLLQDDAPRLLEGFFRRELADFSGLQRLCVVAPLATTLIILYCHHDDYYREGLGLRGRLRRLSARQYNSDISFISAVLTKQSVFVAIAVGVLALVSTQPTNSAFDRVVSRFSIIGLSGSVVCTLISMLCYDYAARFNWRRDFREDLLRRGLVIDSWGWYLLTIFLVLSVALLSPTLSLILNFIYGTLLLYYYYTGEYFHEKEELWTSFEKVIKDRKLQFKVEVVRRADVPARRKGHWHVEMSPLFQKSPAVLPLTCTIKGKPLDEIHSRIEAALEAALGTEAKVKPHNTEPQADG